MKTTKSYGKKILSFILTFAMVIGLLSQLTLPVRAYAPAPSIINSDVSRTSDTEATVKFRFSSAGKAYYNIGSEVSDTSGPGMDCVSQSWNTISLTGLTAGPQDLYIVLKITSGLYETTIIRIPAYISPENNWMNGITATTTTWDNGGTITTAAEFAQFAYNVNNGKTYEGKTITLGNDISLSGKDWTPIGVKFDNPFSGIFDGNGKKITGLQIGTEGGPEGTISYVGLFGMVNMGTIKNLGVDVTIYSGNMSGTVGGLVSYLYLGTISNCYATGNVTGGFYNQVGVLAGAVQNSTVINCFATGNVAATVPSNAMPMEDMYNIGGLAGYCLSSTISNCYAKCNVSGSLNGVSPSNNQIAGGLIGALFASQLNNSYATGNVLSGLSSARGGLVGFLRYDSTISNGFWNSSAIQNTDTRVGVGTDTSSGGSVVTGMTSDNMKNTAFVDTLNSNLSDNYATWKAVTNDYPTLEYNNTTPPVTIGKTITIAATAPVTAATITNGTNTPPAGASGPVITWSADNGVSWTASGSFAAGTVYKTKYVYTANTDYQFDSAITAGDISVTNLGSGTKNVALTDSNKTLTITVTWPATAAIPPTATEYNIWVGGTRVTSANKGSVAGGGFNGTVSYDSSTNTLTLQDAVITGFYTDIYSNAGGIYSSNGLNIALIGSNTIDITFPERGGGVFCQEGNISLSGTGSLTISLGASMYYSAGIYAINDITINGCTVTAAGGQTTTIFDNNSAGISSLFGSLTITNATVIANGGLVDTHASSDGISVNGTLSVTNSMVTATGYRRALWVNSGNISASNSVVTASNDRTGSGAITTTARDAALNGYKYVNIAAAAPTDTTAPSLTAGEVNRTSDTTATVKFTSTEGGTYYYKIGSAVTDTSTGGTAFSAGETTITLTDLAAGAADIYIVAKDAAGNSSVATFKVTIPAYETPTFQVGGTVNDHNINPLSGVAVKLMVGQTQIGDTVTTGEDGTFTILYVPNGTYNLVISKEGIIVTTIITVSNANYAAGTITLPAGKTNSVVEVKGGETPKIVVAKLDEQFMTTVTDNDKGVTAADMTIVTSGGAVEIKIMAEKKDSTAANANEIGIAAGTGNKTVGIFIDLSVVKTVTPLGGASSVTPLTELNQLIEVLIPLDETLQNKSNYVVYRYHGDSVDSITTTANGNGEKIELIDNNKTIKLTVKKFSTYAIAYTPESTPNPTNPPNPTSSEPSLPAINVEQSKGGKVAISTDKKTATITPDDGYVIVDVIVDGKSTGLTEKYTFKDGDTHKISAVFVKKTALPYYNQDGEKVYVGFSAIEENLYKYIAPANVTVEFMENPKNFIDNTIAWAKPSIDFVTEREIFLGTGQNRFSPNAGMTRGMFVAVIGRLYERSYGSVSGTNTFSDVDTKDYYAKYVAWANENGIIKGVGENKFDPNANVTREQMAVIMSNFATLLKKTAITDVSLTYPDSASISSWAIEGAKYCQNTKVIEGRTGGIFAPQESATRAEASAIVQRFLKNMLK